MMIAVLVVLVGCEPVANDPIKKRFDDVRLGSAQTAVERAMGPPIHVRWEYEDATKTIFLIFLDGVLSEMAAQSYEDVVFPSIAQGTPMTRVNELLGRPTSTCYSYDIKLRGLGWICFKDGRVISKDVVPPAPVY